jgi:hypothetical protein
VKSLEDDAKVNEFFRQVDLKSVRNFLSEVLGFVLAEISITEEVF